MKKAKKIKANTDKKIFNHFLGFTERLLRNIVKLKHKSKFIWWKSDFAIIYYHFFWHINTSYDYLQLFVLEFVWTSIETRLEGTINK